MPLPGQPITVLTNHVAVTKYVHESTSLPGVFYRKDDQHLEEKHTDKRIRVIDRLQTATAPAVFQNCVFDGRNLLFVPDVLQLPGNGPTCTFSVNMSDNPNPSPNAVYQVTIARTNNEGITPSAVNTLIRRAAQIGAPTPAALQAINLLQLIIRQHSNNIMKPAVNAKAYFTEKERTSLGGGLDLLRGFFQSVRPTTGKMLINIDTTVAAFIAPGPLIEYMLAVLGTKNIRDLELPSTHPNFKKLERALKKVQLTVQFNKATKIVRGLEPCGGRFRFFNDQLGREMDVEEYYKGTHQYRMHYPKIVGIRLTGPSAPKPIIVAAEVCMIKPGQFYKRKLNEAMTAAAVKFSTLKPHDRRAKIERGLTGGVASPIVHYQQSPYVAAAEMEIGRELESVIGRMLVAPQLTYGQATQTAPPANEVPRGGAWNMLGKRLADPRALDNWAVVNFAPDQINGGMAQGFVTSLAQACMSLAVQTPSGGQPFEGTGHSMDRPLEMALKALDLSKRAVILVFLPQNAKPIRQYVKQWGDIRQGVITQCVRQGKVARANNQYFNNVGIKLNARLGGACVRVKSPTMDILKKAPYMVVGADVSHPAPGQSRPSMTSLVYSHDSEATRFCAINDIQDSRTEAIANMRSYAYQAIRGFVSRNNGEGKIIKFFPTRIVFYRDGISEGEFANVAAQEVKDFKAGIDDALVEYKQKKLAPPNAPGPTVTYVVVGKRHHVVFFPKTPQDGDRTGNLGSGFVTDRGLNSPFAPDFFLQSHSAIQGTSRSSHYVVLHDENWNFDVEPVKQISFHLCHTYAKATRAVSIPSPLACARGAFHCADIDFESDSGTNNMDLQAWRQHFHSTHHRLEKMMYFL
ncbi:Piwi domain-containing protein [Schizophyllum amplum]|uniref:Piwi domain-containing protein n=1 Tax=Schizophyllum amplum TaxID=97359 RepID=A0A550CD10_9AGAR|nr:Piwi domain-containing protein [Auriculariopsis ampla]